MPRERRSLTPGAVVHVTTNTIWGLRAFTPTAKFTRRAIGIFRRYQRRHRMKICCITFMSTHYHLQVIPESQTQLSDFERDVNAALARLVMNLYAIPGPILAGPFEQSEALDDKAALQDFTYILANSTKEGLVESPRHWPGINSAGELCGDPPQIGEYFDGEAYEAAHARDRNVKMAAFWVREPIELTPLPQFEGLTIRQRQTRIQEIVQQIERDAAATRTRPVKGAAAVAAEDPRYIPPLNSAPPPTGADAPARPRDRPITRLKAAGPNAKALIRAAKAARKTAAEQYDRAMEAFLEGRRDVPFPETCFVPLFVRRALAAP